MTMNSFFRQPTTIAGLATLCGTAEAILSGHLTLSGALPLLAGAVVSIVLPDNSAAKTDTEALVRATETLAAALVVKTPAAPSQTGETK